MLTLLITLFAICIIEFAIFLFLEYMSMNNKQKLNDNEYDKLNTNDSRYICGSREDCRENDNTK